MAFDWTKVEGYREDMSADEKLALLDSYEAREDNPAPPKEDPTHAPTPAPTPAKGMVSKAQFDKVSSELAAVKKQLRGKMSEDPERH